MSAETSIEWTDVTWNPVRGCSLVSAGCTNCYAMKVAHRFSGPGKPYEGLTELGPNGPRWSRKIRLVPEALDEPLAWREPRRVFVNSMSDLFHEDIPEEFIAAVFGVMAARPKHTFQVLTKRPERMRDVVSRLTVEMVRECTLRATGVMLAGGWSWPRPNIWLGVSAENQETANERIPLLLQTPAAVRFVSAEPLLGPIDFRREANSRRLWLRGPMAALGGSLRDDWLPPLDWVIVGGESGPGARPCEVAWIASIVEQCRSAGVACFVKQLGAHVIDRNDAGTPQGWQGDPVHIRLRDRKGGDPAEWPEALRVREFPIGGAL